ncbi:MAG: hypothetical protein ACRD2W_24850 [Acidimicrobiales bacterium]
MSVGVAGGLTAALGVASLGWACTTPEGATFFTNGKTSQMVFRGARMSAFATGATQGVQYQLVIGSDGPHPTHACMQVDYVVNSTIRRATTDGFLPPTAGLAGNASLPKATYQVCFRDINGNVATSAATLTII